MTFRERPPDGPRPLGPRLLAGAIGLYRRHLSGRGPLRRVGCTFAHTESCSAFGLRAAREARGAGEALRRIGARLRRCREASLYRDGGALLWGELHDGDAPAALAAALERAGELPATQASVLAASAAVARRRHEPAAARGFLAAARLQADPPPRPRVRPGAGLPGWLVRRAMVGLALAALLAAGCLLLLPPVPGSALAAVALLLGARGTARRLARRRRFQRQARAAHIGLTWDCPSKK